MRFSAMPGCFGGLSIRLPALRRVMRRLDRVAESYEAAIDSDHDRQDLDWMLSGLLCLWSLIQVGVLAHYLRTYPLF